MLDCAKLEFTFTRRGVELEEEELSTMGFTGFSCRLFLMPISAQRVKATMIIFPLPVDELLETYPLAEDLKFPGIAVHKEELELGYRIALTIYINKLLFCNHTRP